MSATNGSGLRENVEFRAEGPRDRAGLPVGSQHARVVQRVQNYVQRVQAAAVLRR